MKVEIPVDGIKVTGEPSTGDVHIEFADIDWAMAPSTARELAFALMTQADRAEGPK